MNLFRCTPDGGLDRKYLRVCAVYRLLKRGVIGKARALELLAARNVPSRQGLVDLWHAHPIKEMRP